MTPLSCDIFNHIKYKVTQKVVWQLYYGFIFPKITYGLNAYGYTSASNISKIQTMQNKLLKLILKLDIRTRTNAVNKTLKILKIEDIHQTKVLALANSCVMKKSCNIWTVLQYQKHSSPLYKESWLFRCIIKPERIRWLTNFGLKVRSSPRLTLRMGVYWI